MKGLLSFLTVYLAFTAGLVSQTLMPIPAHNSAYNGTRGLWFTAPADFVITGVRVPSGAGTGLQYIHVLKDPGPLPTWTWPNLSTAFTTVAYIQGAPNGVIQNVNIPVSSGEVLGILATAGTYTSYSSVSSFSSTIAGQPITLYRLLHQSSIQSGPAFNVSYEAPGIVGRVEIYWKYPSTSPNDAGVTDFIEPVTTCVGTHPVSVEIKNYGINQINSVQVNWRVNGILQPPVSYNQLLDTANGMGSNVDTVTLGNIVLASAITDHIEAWTSLPNGIADTVTSNDTAYLDITGQAYPTIDLGLDTTICPGDSITLDAGPNRDSIIWSTSNTNSRFLSVSSQGIYKVDVYKKACKSSDSIMLSHFNAPPSVDLGNDTTICWDDSVHLDATSSGVSYLWQNNSTSSTQYASNAGTYWVILKDANTCKSGDTIEIDVHQMPSISLTVAPGNNICYGDAFTFRAIPKTAGSIMYQWKINGMNSGVPTTSNTFSPTELEYGDTVSVVLLTDLCVPGVAEIPSNEIVMFINPVPKKISNIQQVDTVIEFTTKLYAIGSMTNHSYLWRVSGGEIVGDSTSNTVKVDWDGPNSNASITLIESDNQNCTRPNVLPVVIISVVGVENENNVTLGEPYPNPANDYLFIPGKFDGNVMIQIQLLDLNGKIMRKIRFEGTGSNIIMMNLDGITSGMYYCRLITDNGTTIVEKIVIEK